MEELLKDSMTQAKDEANKEGKRASNQKSEKGNPEHARDFLKMNDSEILQQVLKDIDASEKNQQLHFDRFDTFYRLYRSYIEKEQMREEGANLFIPYAFHLIETIVPKIVLSIFHQKPYVHTIPLGVDSKKRAEKSNKMNTLLDYQFENKIDLFNTITKVIRSTMTYGTAITKQSWKFKSKVMRVKEQNTIFGFPISSTRTVEKEVVTADHPQIQQIPIKDFFFDPASSNIEDGRYACHRYYEDLSELKKLEREGIYKNIDKVQESTSIEDDMSMLDNIGMTGGGRRAKGVQIHEYWTDDCVVRIANKSQVIFVSENFYDHKQKPYSKWVDTELEGEFYGIGEIEPIVDLQYELNTTRNQRIDNVSLIINNMWKVRRGANIDPNELVSRPNGIVNVDQMDDIEEITIQDVSNSAYNEESIIKEDMDRTTGVFDAVRGSSAPRRETATTSTILANAGGERFELKVKAIASGGLKECVNQIIRLNQQFIDVTTEVNIMGVDGTTQQINVSPVEILGEYDIVAVGSIVEPILNKEIRQNYLIQLLNVLQNNPNVNQYEFLKRLFSAFDFKDLESLINAQPTPEEENGTPPIDGQGNMPMDFNGMVM